jgi:LPPG:FO 2-phospho-L-lactate transferase
VKVTALAGGVGGAKLLVGLQKVLGDQLIAIVNTGDDATMYGVHVSPDIDIVAYWLAWIADTERGWGIRGDTFNVVAGFASLGHETWFGLGDRDFATCLYRTERLRSGATLAAVTDDVRSALGVTARVLPATDDPLRTQIVTTTGETLDFQEYFVRDRCEPTATDVLISGIGDAKPAPGVIEAIESAERVIVCPSNPILSIGPILALPEVRDALRAHPYTTAVTPIIRGAALKGPADKLLDSLGHSPTASGVARIYADFLDCFVVDQTDPGEVRPVQDLGVRAVTRDTIMSDSQASARLARELLEA